MAIEYAPFGGWSKNLRLFNGAAELFLTLEVGPRILSYRPAGGENVFKVVSAQAGRTNEVDWCIRGGHRLWLAPEVYGTKDSLTYTLDNSEVAHSIESDLRVRVEHLTENPAKIRRGLIVELDPVGPQVTVEHWIRNESEQPIEFAAWALSVMAPGGFAAIPQPFIGSHPEDFIPNRNLVLWPFTDLADERLHFGRRLLRLTQADRGPIKFGLRHTEGWAAYILRDHLFLKSIPFEPGAVYPDFGSNFETFTNPEFLELESLGPLTTVPAGATVRLPERWAVFRGVTLPDPRNEEEFLKSMASFAKQLA